MKKCFISNPYIHAYFEIQQHTFEKQKMEVTPLIKVLEENMKISKLVNIIQAIISTFKTVSDYSLYKNEIFFSNFQKSVRILKRKKKKCII